MSTVTIKTDLAHIHQLGLDLQAFAAEQLGQAQDWLARAGEARHQGVHEARKCIRRTRAALALGASKFDQRATRLDRDLARLCRGLSTLRDAQALIEALQRLSDNASAELCAMLPQAKLAAQQRREQVLKRALKRDPELASRRRRLQAAQQRLLHLPWQEVGAKAVAKAVARSKRRVHKARRQVQRHPDDDVAWHRLRRRLRRVRHQELMLAQLSGTQLKHKSFERKGNQLGESQDDALLPKHCGRGSPFTPAQRKLLRKITRARLRHTRAAKWHDA